ncbi:MAG TPA: hypothetical protein VGD55_07525, partial [Acidothermaceae bacterium]
MMTLKIAFRNILRNRRRSAMTLLAVAVGAMGVVLFGEFVRFVTAGLETNAVQKVGHLTVFRTGYFAFGAGNPAEYGIDGYTNVVELIRRDRILAPRLNVVTPIVSLAGIAGNFDLDASKTFMGTGVVPSDHDRLSRWDEHRVNRRRALVDSGLRDDDETRGVVGVGLGRVLGFCERLHIGDCPPRPNAAAASGPALDGQLAGLALKERVPSAGTGRDASPQLDLLAATAGGAPHVVSMAVSRAEPQGARELDDNFIAMHIALAQKLVYGRMPAQATGIVVQLHHTADLPLAR